MSQARQIKAWECHLERLGLRDKQIFARWLSHALTVEEFALLLDAEVDRRSLWEIYLAEQFGPWES
jgi:hypothetical protein